jgi:hypothetical protein
MYIKSSKIHRNNCLGIQEVSFFTKQYPIFSSTNAVMFLYSFQMSIIRQCTYTSIDRSIWRQGIFQYISNHTRPRSRNIIQCTRHRDKGLRSIKIICIDNCKTPRNHLLRAENSVSSSPWFLTMRSIIPSETRHIKFLIDI